MSVNTANLRKVNTLRTTDLPDILTEPDEYITLRASRNFIDDAYAQVKAQRNKNETEVVDDTEVEDELHREGRILELGEQDPDIVELEQREEKAFESEMETHNGEFWWGIFDYMCKDFLVWDVQPGKERRKMDPADPRDRRMLFEIAGDDLLPFLQVKAGGTPTTDQVNGDGKKSKPETGNTLGATENEEKVPSA